MDVFHIYIISCSSFHCLVHLLRNGDTSLLSKRERVVCMCVWERERERVRETQWKEKCQFIDSNNRQAGELLLIHLLQRVRRREGRKKLIWEVFGMNWNEFKYWHKTYCLSFWVSTKAKAGMRIVCLKKTYLVLVICGLFICEFVYMRLGMIFFYRTYPLIYSHPWSFYIQICYMRVIFYGPYLSQITRSTCTYISLFLCDVLKFTSKCLASTNSADRIVFNLKSLHCDYSNFLVLLRSWSKCTKSVTLFHKIKNVAFAAWKHNKNIFKQANN
jgi:hypothetical protein